MELFLIGEQCLPRQYRLSNKNSSHRCGLRLFKCWSMGFHRFPPPKNQRLLSLSSFFIQDLMVRFLLKTIAKGSIHFCWRIWRNIQAGPKLVSSSSLLVSCNGVRTIAHEPSAVVTLFKIKGLKIPTCKGEGLVNFYNHFADMSP